MSMKYEKGSFITVPSRSALRGLHPTAQTLYMWLCGYANETYNCFPSRETLASDVGVSVRTIDSMLDILEKAGLVEKNHRFDDDKQVSNFYTIMVRGAESAGGGAKSAPRGAQNLRTELNPLVTQSSLASREVYESPFLEDDNSPKSRKPKKITKEMQEVFEIFKDIPARYVWGRMVLQRDAAQVLYEQYGVEQLRNRYSVVMMYRDDPYCPEIASPAEFLSKMPKMEAFLKRNSS